MGTSMSIFDLIFLYNTCKQCSNTKTMGWEFFDDLQYFSVSISKLSIHFSAYISTIKLKYGFLFRHNGHFQPIHHHLNSHPRAWCFSPKTHTSSVHIAHFQLCGIYQLPLALNTWVRLWKEWSKHLPLTHASGDGAKLGADISIWLLNLLCNVNINDLFWQQPKVPET